MKNKLLTHNTEWMTIEEAVIFINNKSGLSVDKSYLYRLSLSGHITLSVYFQSPFILKKIERITKNCFMYKHQNPLFKLCHTNPVAIGYDKHQPTCLIKTTGDTLFSTCPVWDTKLTGIEKTYIQKELAFSLNIPAPLTGLLNHYPGIIVNDPHGNSYQLFEMSTIKERINKQLSNIKKECEFTSSIMEISRCNEPETQTLLRRKMYFPVYQLPEDTTFVVRKEYIVEFLTRNISQDCNQTTSRLSTPLARFFWLACKNNPHIGGELLKHPYKLLSLFELWAREAGITDRLNGDTLKNALDRGCPSISSAFTALSEPPKHPPFSE